MDTNDESINNTNDFNDCKQSIWAKDTNDESINNSTDYNNGKDDTRAMSASVTQIKQEAETLDTSDTD